MGPSRDDEVFTERKKLLAPRAINEIDDTKRLLEKSNVFYQSTDVMVERVMLKKHITLIQAVALIVGGVAGSGIFIAPTGVTAHVGSLGLSLLVWGSAGVFNILLALCYAELGTALPVAGGDYAYLHNILGPLPAFLCLWTTSMIVAPGNAALMARTASVYLFAIADINCNSMIVTLLAIWIIVGTAYLNSISVKWSTKFLEVCSVTKLLALGAVIVLGIILLARGNTSNFTSAFEGSKYDLPSLVGGFLPGFIAYIGWDAVNNLAEEMQNPARDLPLSVTLSMFVVTIIYVLVNMSFFTVLTPMEFASTSAVAMLWAAKILGTVAWMIPVCVAMSGTGSAIGIFLALPRYVFAGAREGQFPKVFSYVSLSHFTPIPAIILIAAVASFFTFFDIQALLDMISVISMIKIALTLVALLRFKWTRSDLPSSVKVPSVLVALSIVVLLICIVVSVYLNPILHGSAMLLFFAGIPIYFLGNICKRTQMALSLSDFIALVSQNILILVPGGQKDP